MAERAAEAARRDPGRRWLPSVRWGAALAAGLAVAIVLSAGAFVAMRHLDQALTRSILDAARSRAGAITAALADGATPALLVGSGDESEFVQVLGPDGDVVTASTLLERAGPLDPGATTVRLTSNGTRYLVHREPIVRSALNLTGGTVVVGRSAAPRQESTAAFGAIVRVAVPALTLLVAALTWVLVGRSLRPVERMRRQVEDLSSRTLHRRIVDPGGEDEIARLARTMNAMLDRLESAELRQRRFVSDASHELRSPIAVIRQNAELELSYPDAVDPRELAEQTHAEALRLQRLVEDLLFLSRWDEADRTPARQARAAVVDLRDLLVVAAARIGPDGPTVRLDGVGVGGPPADGAGGAPAEGSAGGTHGGRKGAAAPAARVRGDAQLLARLFGNVIDNAARHARSRVDVDLRLDPHADGGAAGDTDAARDIGAARAAAGRGRRVVVAVSDDGAGIAAAERERVFERFVRLDEARARDEGGSGLGLAIVREIARAHGGEVTIGAAAAGGARVEIDLPAG